MTKIDYEREQHDLQLDRENFMESLRSEMRRQLSEAEHKRRREAINGALSKVQG